MADKEWGGFGTALSTLVGERLASPLTSTFAISWSLWNFKFFVILLSKNSVTDTYALIQTECFPNWYMSFFNGLVAPLTLTMAYFYLLPFLSKVIFEEWSRTQKETKDIKQRWEDQELLGSADAIELRRKLRAAELQYEDAGYETRKLNAEARLNDQLLTEARESHRVALAKHKSVGDELSRTSASVDQLRNEIASLRDQLNTSQMQKTQAEGQLSALQREFASHSSTAHLTPSMITLLKSLTGGQKSFGKYIGTLGTAEKGKVPSELDFLRSNGHTRASARSGGPGVVTPRGLTQLLLQGKLTDDEFLTLSKI